MYIETIGYPGFVYWGLAAVDARPTVFVTGVPPGARLRLAEFYATHDGSGYGLVIDADTSAFSWPYPPVSNSTITTPPRSGDTVLGFRCGSPDNQSRDLAVAFKLQVETGTATDVFVDVDPANVTIEGLGLFADSGDEEVPACFWTDLAFATQSACTPPGGTCIIFTAEGGEPLWTDAYGDPAVAPATMTDEYLGFYLNGYARPERAGEGVDTITLRMSATLLASAPGVTVTAYCSIGATYDEYTLQPNVPLVLEGTFAGYDDMSRPEVNVTAEADDYSEITVLFDVSEVEVCYKPAPLFVATKLAKVNLDGTYDTSFPIFGGSFGLSPLPDGTALLLGGVYGSEPNTRDGVELPRFARISASGAVIEAWEFSNGTSIYSSAQLEPDRLDYRVVLQRWDDDTSAYERLLITPTGDSVFTFPATVGTLVYIDAADRCYYVTPGPNATGWFLSHTQHLDRYLPNGTLDPTFTRITYYSGATNRPSYILRVVEANGMLYVFHAVQSSSRANATRYTLAGTPDITMSADVRPRAGTSHPRLHAVWDGRLVYTGVMVDGVNYGVAVFDEDFILDTVRSHVTPENELGPRGHTYCGGQYAANVLPYGAEPPTRVYLGTDLPLSSFVEMNYTDRSNNTVMAAPGHLWKPLTSGGYWEI